MNPVKLWSPEEQKFYNEKVWHQTTIGDEFAMWCERFSDNTALISGEVKVSYRTLAAEVAGMASFLQERNIRRGDCVLLQLTNSIGFVKVLFALIRIGAVPVLLLPAQRAMDVVTLCGKSEATHYISTDRFNNTDYTEIISLLKKDYPDTGIITLSSEKDSDLVLSGYHGKQEFIYESGSNLDVAVLLLSGGTTGTPKLIPRTHAGYSYNFRTMAGITGMNEKSVYLNILPTAHNFSLSCPGIMGVLSAGGTVVIAKSGSFDEGFELIAKHKVTITAMVPTLAKLWAEAVEWDEPDLSSLKVLQVGGARLEYDDAVNMRKAFGCKLQQVFGTAEGLICCTRLEDSDETVARTQGRPISPYDVCRIVDDDGNDLPEGAVGELIVRGPYTINEYYMGGDKNLSGFTPDGFYRMGDLVRLTADGNYQVMGRVKEQINRAGEKISPVEIENMLVKHAAIESCVAVPVKDEILGERICVFAIGEPVELGDVRDFLLKSGLALFKLPDQLVFIPAWPLTAVGKIDKKRLSAMGENSD